MQSTAPAPSLRERKKQRIRMDLTRAAVELAAEQGYETTTVEQIAARAEVSPRTFFRYFGAKEDVLFGDTPEQLAMLREELAAVGSTETPISTATQILRRAVLNWTVFDDAELEAECARLWREEAAPRRKYIEVILEWEDVIAAFFARQWDLSPYSVRCRLTAMSLIAATRVSLSQEVHGREAAAESLDESLRLLHRGIHDDPHDSHPTEDKEAQ